VEGAETFAEGRAPVGGPQLNRKRVHVSRNPERPRGFHTDENIAGGHTQESFNDARKSFVDRHRNAPNKFGHPFPERSNFNYWVPIMGQKRMVVVRASGLAGAGIEGHTGVQIDEIVRSEEKGYDANKKLLENAVITKPGHHLIFFSERLPHTAPRVPETEGLLPLKNLVERKIADEVFEALKRTTDSETSPSEEEVAKHIYELGMSSWSQYFRERETTESALRRLSRILEESGGEIKSED